MLRRSSSSTAGVTHGIADCSTLRNIVRFFRSARTAASMPGYCTFTATTRPSCSRAR
ncbi:Uncharacterised protein [Mycobacteroides abscessus subsp. abscessus]|nr:Uncharacterised protein [Mycobacteroides abscessus subsp. abscessus]